MATPIKIKRSAVADKRPALSDLQLGELALNTYDGRLYTERDAGGVGIGTTISLLTPWTENYGGDSVYALSNIGIGTTMLQKGGIQPPERVEIYRDVILKGNHTGVGGTTSSGIGRTSIVRIGINSDIPGGCLDLRYGGGPLCLPVAVAAGGTAGAGNEGYFHSEGTQLGNMWIDKPNMKLVVALNNGDITNISTESYKQPQDYDFIRGWHGPLIPNETIRDTDADIIPDKPVEEPVGWNTSNVVYNTGVDQFQYRTTLGKWKTQVSTAQTGTEIIINGTTAILNVAGIGSISLGTLS